MNPFVVLFALSRDPSHGSQQNGPSVGQCHKDMNSELLWTLSHAGRYFGVISLDCFGNKLQQ